MIAITSKQTAIKTMNEQNYEQIVIKNSIQFNSYISFT